MKGYQRGFSIVEVLIIILVVSFIGFTSFSVYKWKQPNDFDTQKMEEEKVLALPEIESIHNEKVSLLKELGVTDSSLGISKVDVCDTRKNFGGFFDAYWGERYFMTCHFRYVELFSTNTSKQDTVDKLIASSWKENFNDSIVTLDYANSYTECQVSNFESAESPRIIYASLEDRGTNNSYCETPDLLREHGFAPGGFVDTSIIKSSELSEDYKNSKSNLLWVVTDHEYFYEMIKNLDRGN